MIFKFKRITLTPNNEIHLVVQCAIFLFIFLILFFATLALYCFDVGKTVPKHRIRSQYTNICNAKQCTHCISSIDPCELDTDNLLCKCTQTSNTNNTIDWTTKQVSQMIATIAFQSRLAMFGTSLFADSSKKFFRGTLAKHLPC